MDEVFCPKCNYPMIKNGFKLKKQNYRCKNPVTPHESIHPNFKKCEIDLENPLETVWEYIDKKKPAEHNFRHFFDVARTNQQLNYDLSTSQETGRLCFETSKQWIPIIFSSDWHMGSNAADYDQLQKHLEMVLENEIYMLLFGDLNDNFIRFRSIQPVLEQVLNPKIQHELLASIIKEFQQAVPKRILAAWWGNHDVQRDEQILGSSRVKQMLAKEFIYFNGKGVLEIQINDIKYHIGGSHFFKGFSIYNKTHALIRAIRYEFGGLCDVVAMGHLHNDAYSFIRDYEIMQEFGYDLGGDLHMLQIGTFNIDDGFSKRFFKRGQVGTPILLFNTEEKDIIWLKKPEYVYKYL